MGLQPNRAEVILAGACIVLTVMDKLRKASLSVSDRCSSHCGSMAAIWVKSWWRTAWSRSTEAFAS